MNVRLLCAACFVALALTALIGISAAGSLVLACLCWPAAR